ncbi:MAG: FlgD immunoglobulin-like domain containing protein [bacterium]
MCIFWGKFRYNGKISDYSNETFTSTPLKPYFALYNNLFDPTKGEEVIIKYSLSWDSFVEIKIYTLDGELVSPLVLKNQSAGEYQLNWSGKDEDGEIVASGIYLAYFNVGYFEEIKKMAVIK